MQFQPDKKIIETLEFFSYADMKREKLVSKVFFIKIFGHLSNFKFSDRSYPGSQT